MSLYDNLLPPPARSGLSRLPEGVRGHLPDFTLAAAPADALRQWARALFFIELGRAWTHVYVCTGVLTALFLFIWLCIFTPRILNGTFWLFRIVRKPAGVLLVPNAMMGFTCLASVFGVLLLAWQYMIHKWTVLKQGSPDLFWLFTLCIWMPLFSASLSSTWGLFHSLPNTYSSSVESRTDAGVVRRTLSKPIALNLFGLALPFVQAASIAVPAGLCHVRYMHSLSLYQTWEAKYAAQTELSREMLLEAQEFWYALYPVFDLVAFTFFLWFAWAILEFFAYTFLSLRLARVLSRQLALLRKRVTGNEVTTMQLFVPKLGNPFRFRLAKDDDVSDGTDGPGAAAAGFVFPPAKATHIVRRQAPRTVSNDTTKKITHLTTVLYHVIVQLFVIAPTTLAFGAISLYLAIKLRGDIESPQMVWNESGASALIAVNYTAVIAGFIVLLSIAKRGQRRYEPVLHFRGYAGSDEDRVVRKGSGRHIPGLRLPGLASSAGNGDDGRGAAFTSFFESESIQRPPTFARGDDHARRRSWHELKDVERSDQRSLDLLGSPRRFSQTIYITEDVDDIQRDLDEQECMSKQSEDWGSNRSPSSPSLGLLRSTTFDTLSDFMWNTSLQHPA